MIKGTNNDNKFDDLESSGTYLNRHGDGTQIIKSSNKQNEEKDDLSS